jgi:phage terminase large subunit-like protein
LNLNYLNYSEKRELLALLEERERRKRLNKIITYYPDDGHLRRELYVKHMEFFTAGAKYRERAILAANRIGKTESIGAFEVSLHLTGLYPDWWPGRRFDEPVACWAAGDTGKTVRGTIQYKLLGTTGEYGTGMIPGRSLIGTTPKHGLPDAVDQIKVRHISGGISMCELKSYDQKRESFQGTEQHVIWLDEEPPMAIYTECLLRTMTTNGIVMATFTPLLGISDVVMSFMPKSKTCQEILWGTQKYYPGKSGNRF